MSDERSSCSAASSACRARATSASATSASIALPSPAPSCRRAVASISSAKRATRVATATRCRASTPEVKAWVTSRRTSQLAALAYVDGQLAPLFAALRRRAPLLAIVCSDHGTAYGEDGYAGHRLAHPVVWEVPYAELTLARMRDDTAAGAAAGELA